MTPVSRITRRPVVAEVMTQPALTVGKKLKLAELGQFFVKHRISGAPVVDDENRLVGVVSLHDLAADGRPPFPSQVRHLYYDDPVLVGAPETEVLPWADDRGQELRVQDIMTPLVFCVEESEPIDEVVRLMKDAKVHRVVVTRDTEVIGVVSSMDLVAIIPDLLALISPQEPAR